MFKSSPVGNEITSIMYGIRPGILNDVERLKEGLLKAVKGEKFKIVKKMTYSFKPYGFTAVFLIQESHIAIHTYPEYNCLVFNLYSCRGPQDGRQAYEIFKEVVKPRYVKFRQSKVPLIRKA